MLKNELLESGYQFKLVEPGRKIINFVWAVFTLAAIAPVVFVYILILGGNLNYLPIPYIEFNIIVVNIMFIAVPVCYLVLKEVFISVFCFEKNRDIKLKLQNETEMPINAYREAFKAWQIMAVHSILPVIMYILIFITGIVSGGDINLFILICIMAFILSFDLTLVVYVLYLKLRYNADYISVNKHIYSITLYFKTYVAKKRKKIKIPLPQIDLKKFLIPAAVSVIVFFAVYYIVSKMEEYEKYIEPNLEDFDNYLEYIDKTRPKITKYEGDIFADSAEGYGGKKLAGGNLLYCGDDKAVIYFDKEKKANIRLNSSDEKNKLCIYEKCVAEFEEVCGHMPDFVSKGAYYDGVLYGVRSYTENKKTISYALRYDISKNTVEKLAEFKAGDESTHIRDIFVLSHYLFIVHFSYYGGLDTAANLTVARLDLENTKACVVYSDNKNPRDQDKMGNLLYDNGALFSATPYEPVMTNLPVNGMIYQTDLNMSGFFIMADLGCYMVTADDGKRYYLPFTARQADTHGGYIYYTKNPGDTLFRRDLKTKEEESVLYGVSSFFIENGFLYYGSSEVYKINLEGGGYTDPENQVPYVDFDAKTDVYKPEAGYFLGEWSVKDGYVYALLRSEKDGETLARININSNKVFKIL